MIDVCVQDAHQFSADDIDLQDDMDEFEAAMASMGSADARAKQVNTLLAQKREEYDELVSALMALYFSLSLCAFARAGCVIRIIPVYR